jgi:hypothetical protein
MTLNWNNLKKEIQFIIGLRIEEFFVLGWEVYRSLFLKQIGSLVHLRPSGLQGRI